MKKVLKVVEFMKNNENWEKILIEKPYCLTIQREKMVCHDINRTSYNLILLKYNQIESDFSNEIVRECRGLILNEDTLEPVCVPFFKFGNYGEGWVPKIDWNNCWIGQKIDGSLIKVTRIGDSDLLISTNGTINAFGADLQDQIGCPYKNFGSLFQAAISKAINNYQKGKVCLSWFRTPFQELADYLEKGKTYMFELVSPYNRVVVPWDDIDVYFLGERDNETLQETYFSDNVRLSKIFKTPKIFPLNNLEECLSATQAMGWDEEGFVVCDKNFNRIKIKSPSYVAIHHIRGDNGMISYKRALEIVKKNEVAEVLNYFPEFKSAFDEISKRFNEKVNEIQTCWDELNKKIDELPTRKDQALWITSHCSLPGFIFALLDKKYESVNEAILSCTNDKLIKMLGFKE